ncbi:response regulator transcription factor [Pseudomonas atacamensis]|uniref:response regulator transcription factor n=1 Tax=Pseudomonas atacamensis TaxID=2565368 RepID=UPI002493242C|nr:response regulator transcription factor [Pseudomonas atacamensis]
MSSLIRVGVLDEQEVVHYGLRFCFSDLPDISLAGAYRRAHLALRAVKQGNIDLLIMDHLLKSGDGIGYIRNLRINHPKLRVLVFLAAPCPTTMTVLMDVGVHGIVCKRQPLIACIHAIRLLASGQRYLCPSIADLSSPPYQAVGNDAEEALLSFPSLTHREKEVLRLCIDGLTVTRIAELSCRSLKTVSTQKQAAYRKLGLKGDMDLFRRLARYGV